MTDYEWTAEVQPPDWEGDVRVLLALDGGWKHGVRVWAKEAGDPTAAAEALVRQINARPRQVDGPLRVERHAGGAVLCLGHLRWWLTRAEADAIEAQLAATAPDLPPHVAQALVDGLPDGVRVGLIADGRDIPDGWGCQCNRSLGWRPSDAADPEEIYEVRPPAPAVPQTVTVELPVDVVRDYAVKMSGRSDHDDAIAVACRAALPEGDQR